MVPVSCNVFCFWKASFELYGKHRINELFSIFHNLGHLQKAWLFETFGTCEGQPDIKENT